MTDKARAEELVGKAETITDTIPASAFDGVAKYYNRHGYKLRSYVLVSSDTYEATFVAASEE